MCIQIQQHLPQASRPTAKLRGASERAEGTTHVTQNSPMALARSSARLPYTLLHSDEPDQALKHPQRIISTAAFMFASRNLFWHLAQVVPTDREFKMG